MTDDANETETEEAEFSPTVEAQLLSLREWGIGEVAKFCHVKPYWVKRKTREGVIPHKIKAGKPRYVPSEVRGWWDKYDESEQKRGPKKAKH